MNIFDPVLAPQNPVFRHPALAGAEYLIDKIMKKGLDVSCVPREMDAL